MLAYYKDAALTIPVTDDRPLWVLVPEKGGTKQITLWLADTYSATTSSAASPGDTELKLAETSALPDSGHLVVGGITVSYTGKTLSKVTGIPASGAGSITLTLPAGTAAYPKLTYRATDAFLIWPMSMGPALSLRQSGQSNFGIPGTPLMVPFTTASSVSSTSPVALAQIEVRVTVPAGAREELRNWGLRTTALTIDELPDVNVSAPVQGSAVRADQTLLQRCRFYPESRRILPHLPGFIFGEYRWRDASEVNAHEIVEAQSDLDPVSIGLEKFASGIGDGTDLAPVDLEVSTDSASPHSIFLRIKHGEYFIGPNRNFLAADGASRFIIPVFRDGQEISLGCRPKPLLPVTVAVYKADLEGRLRDYVVYQCQNEEFDGTETGYRFRLDRAGRKVILNKVFDPGVQFVGIAPGAVKATFSAPIFPFAAVNRAYLGVWGSNPEEDVPVLSFDSVEGIFTVDLSGASNPQGRELYVECRPAVLVTVEPDSAADTVLLTETDLNPAFSGLSSGYVYLEHRRQRVANLELYCDKPRIITPQAYSMVSGLLSFGPVFYENDFAMLQVKAYGSSGEALIGARLKVVAASDFKGSVNYTDPLSTPVTLVTGADGKAAMLYLPPDAYGQFLATSSISGSTVTLPAPVPIQQLWNSDEGWLARMYLVYNNDAFFGKVGAQSQFGEIAWQATGTPGTIAYKTNGRRVGWKNGTVPILPSAVYDAAGKSSVQSGFDGNVVQIVYPSALPTSVTIGSYFLTYTGRVLLSVTDSESGLSSNQILLTLATPPEVVDESGVSGYLRPDQGRLNINRLGGAAILPINVNTSRY